MADEIINKLGFDVSDALTALAKLDQGLQTSASALTSHATALSNWNSGAQAALATMREMASLSGKLTGGSKTATTGAAGASVASADTISKLQSAISLTQQYGGKVSMVGDQLRVMGMQSSEALDKARNSTEHLTVSFGTLVRIVTTQLIIRAINAFKNALEESVTAAIDLQTQVAEIFVIAPKTDTFRSITDEIKNMSNAMNIPAGDVAEGLYQTISDQFTTVGERANIMTAAMQLSRAGVVDLGSAVTLLTSTINAYGMESSQAGLLAGQFFKVIELGHVRGKELADTMGQVLPIAQQLGVSAKEVGAAYISMTIGGLDAHKVSTGLRQAMVAFIKPSDDMKKALRELGFATPEQLIQAKGLIGAMQAISDRADGMTTGISAAVRNVRAFTATLSLTREGAEKYTEAMDALNTVTSTTMEETNKLFQSSMSTEKFTSSVNKMKNSLTTELGPAITEVLSKMITTVGMDNITAGITTLVRWLGTLSIAFGVAATAAVLFWVAATGPVGLIVGGFIAIAAAIGLTTFAEEKAMLAMKTRYAAMEEANQKATADLKNENNKRQADEERAALERAKIFENSMSEVRKLNYKLVDSAKEASDTMIDDTRIATGTIISSQERVVVAYRNAAKEAITASRAIHDQRIADELDYAETVFRFSMRGKSTQEKIDAELSRARRLASEAEARARQVTTPEAANQNRQTWTAAEATANQALQDAMAAGSTSKVEDAERIILSIKRQKIEAEKSIEQSLSKQGKTQLTTAANEQQRLDTMKSAQKEILEGLKIQEKGEVLSSKTLESNKKKVEQNVKTLLGQWKGSRGMGAATQDEVTKLMSQIQGATEGGISKQQITRLEATPEALSRLHSQVQNGLGKFTAIIDATNMQLPDAMKEHLKGKTLDETTSLYSQYRAEAEKTMADVESAERALTETRKSMAGTRKTGTAQADDWVKMLQARLLEVADPRSQKIKDFVTSPFIQKPVSIQKSPEVLQSDVRLLYDQIQNMLTQTGEKLDPQAFRKLTAAKEAYIKRFNPGRAEVTTLEELVKSLKKVQDDATTVKEASKKASLGAEQNKNARKVLDTIPSAVIEMEKAAEKAKTDTDAIKSNTTTSAQQTQTMIQYSLQTMVFESAQIANNIAAAAMSMSSLSMEGNAATAMRGGFPGRYFANGGPVGTDTIPAWLSKGEFVVNANASQKFASQLVAMNAGSQPVYRSEGGSVTTVGDINVTVNGGSTSKQTIREISEGLRREVRRGTIKLK